MSILKRPARLVGSRIGRWPVLTVWAFLLSAAFLYGGDLDEVKNEATLGQLPESVESARAEAVYDEHFDDDGHEPLFVVYSRPGGLVEADLAAAREHHEQLTAELAMEGADTPPPMPSADGEAILTVIALPADAVSDEDVVAEETVPAVLDLVRDAPEGLEVLLAGPVAAMYDVDASFEGLDETLMLVTAAIVAILLLLVYRSPLLVLSALTCSGAAILLSQLGVYLLAKHAGLAVDSQSTGILTVLVFGVGTDYALLLIARYREELRSRADRFTAMGAALSASLPTLLATAGTTGLAMLMLLFALQPSTAALGPVAATGIVSALLAMTTLLPALLAVFGRAAFWPMTPRHDEAGVRRRHRFWSRLAEAVARRPRPIWIVTALCLGGTAFGAVTLSGGLTVSDGFTDPPDSVRAAQLMEEHYEGGRSAPTEILAPADEAEAAAASAEATAGVEQVLEPEESRDGAWVRIRAVLEQDPLSAEAEATVKRLRENLSRTAPGALVGGETAASVDVAAVGERDLRVVIPLIGVAVFLVLLALLRALVAATVVLASVMLSYAAAIGAAASALYAAGYNTVESSFFLYGFLFLVALGVDYTIFVVSRAKEETERLGHREGTVRALTVTGGVVTSAGAVLAATFAALLSMPLLFMLQIGTVVAIGVLLDTMVVRTLLVPALALDLGPRIWWPGALSRRSVAPAVSAREPARAAR